MGLTEGVIIALIGLVASLIGGVFVLVRALRESKATQAANAAAAAQATFAQNIELNKYIDERIAKALVEPKEQIATLQNELKLVKTRESTTKDILRRWVQRLLWWDARGRAGEMPMPTDADMATLDLADIESDTLTARELASIRDTSEKEKT